MDEEFNDTFDYSDIIPLNYKSKSLLSNEFDEIYNNTENTKIDWRKRELALKKIARICLGNQGKSDTFLQFFNGQIYPNLDIQLADLRSSLMKEACRIVSFCARELGLLIESSMVHMMSQHVLFKIAGNSNKVISENSSRCVLNIVKYVHSIKIITNICEQKILKANNVRVLVSQCIYIIICSYKNNLIQKTLGIIIETIKTLLSDPNSDVRATTRKVFIAFKKRYENDGNNLYNELEKNVQKQINEDEKIMWNIIDIKVDDNIEKNNINIKKNTINTVKKAYSSGLNKLNNNGIKKNNINNKGSKESITHKSNINITPVKAKKPKNLYASNIKEKSHEIKFENKNINYENVNKINNKSKINTSAINKKSLKEYIIKKETNNNKDNINNNKDSQEFVFTNLNLLRKARLENSLKNKNKPNHKAKIKNKPIINKNSFQSPTKRKTESSPQLNIKAKDYSNKLRNSLKEKNLNDLKISNSELNSERKTKSEEKLLILIRKLDETNSDNDKLLVFQYFYNDFSQILKDIKYFSEVSIRKYIDKHIEYFGGEEQRIVAQVIKNMMRMIYYMYNFFSKYDIENIIKLMLMQLKKLKQENIISDNIENEDNPHNNDETSVYKLIFQLYVIMFRKNEGENLIKTFFSIMKGMNESEPSNNGNNNYDFDTFFDWLTNLITSNPNFLENPITFKKYFKILLDSLYIDSAKLLEFIEFLYKLYNENFVSTFKEETEENKKNLTSFLEKNKSSIYQEILNLSKLRATRKNSENKLNNTYNSVDEDYEELPEEIINYIKSNDLNGFKTSLEKNKSLIPSFLLLLSENEFKEIKDIEILINFTYAILASSGDIFIPELDKCIELFINQVIHIILTNFKNGNIIKIASDILVMAPMKLNSEKFFKTISQYLNIKSDDELLKILLRSIKNFILDNKTKFLEKILPYFAENLLGLINHSTKEIKEEAVYCCVEIIMVVGYKFDKYLELLPKNQQNLINFFIKKRTG